MSNPYAEQNFGGAFSPRVASAKSLASVVYALQAASVLFGLTAIVAVIINYVKMDDVRGTWVETHFRWQIRTFWLGFLFGVLALVVGAVVFVGALGLSATEGAEAAGGGLAGLGMLGVMLFPLAMLVWYVYRVVKGWLRLNENQPVG